VSPLGLQEQGLLHASDLEGADRFPTDHVDFERVLPFRRGLLDRAFERFEAGDSRVSPEDFDAFCRANAFWLDDYALFMALKAAHNETCWTDWPAELAGREPEALARAAATHAREVRRHRFWQFLFDTQWRHLKHYCAARSIRLFGDLPI